MGQVGGREGENAKSEYNDLSGRYIKLNSKRRLRDGWNVLSHPPKSEHPPSATGARPGGLAPYSSSLPNSIAFTFLARLLGIAGPFVFGGGALFLAGRLETGLVSGLGETCGRLAFRDSISWRRSETSAADVCTGLEDGPLALPKAAETLTGYDDGSGGGNPNVGGFSRHLRDCASRATERNSLVANAAASEGDSSLKSIVIGFLEESPRVKLIFVPFSGFQFPTIRSVVTIVLARRSPNASSMSSVGLGPVTAFTSSSVHLPLHHLPSGPDNPR